VKEMSNLNVIKSKHN